MSFRIFDRPLVRALGWFAAWMLFGFALIESVHVAIDWWHGRIETLGLREGFWLLMLPVLVTAYLRYFSIFNPDCQRCRPLPPGDADDRRSSPGP